MVRAFPIPLVSETARDSELESDFGKPLASDSVNEIKPDSDLRNENFCAPLRD